MEPRYKLTMSAGKQLMALKKKEINESELRCKSTNSCAFGYFFIILSAREEPENLPIVYGMLYAITVPMQLISRAIYNGKIRPDVICNRRIGNSTETLFRAYKASIINAARNKFCGSNDIISSVLKSLPDTSQSNINTAMTINGSILITFPILVFISKIYLLWLIKLKSYKLQIQNNFIELLPSSPLATLA